jgi:lipopolysaccharide export system permease protein
MKIIDRYLIKQFLLTLLFGLLAFTLIFVVIDMMENLDDFIDQNVQTKIVFIYYLVFTPEIIKLMTPVAVLFSGLFTTGKMANLNELTSIKSSGVSLYRYMAPFFIVTLLISLFSIYFGGYVVPAANKTKIKIEQVYLKKGITFSGSNIFFQDSKIRAIGISFFDNSTNTANRVTIQEFDPKDFTRIVSRIDAQTMRYDSVAKCWIAARGIQRFFTPDAERINCFTELKLTNLNFLPNEVDAKQLKPEQMNLQQLKELIANMQKAGNDPTRIMIEYYSRYAFAMAAMVVILFGLPLSANKRKGGLALQFGINILVTFIYLGFMQISQAFGKNGALDPILTAWLANIVFFAAAIINIARAQK